MGRGTRNVEMWAGRRELRDLAACPACDLLHRRAALAAGAAARCARCGTVIETRRPGAVDRLLAVSLAMPVLMALALWAPFLTLRQGGLAQQISILDAAGALGADALAPLGVFVLAAIVGLPLARTAAHLYAFAPQRLGFEPPRHAAWAFRWATRLRPWAMVEIFLIGVAVALVKLAGLAAVTPGPAFWALCGVVVLIAGENAAVSRESLWRRLDGEPAT